MNRLAQRLLLAGGVALIAALVWHHMDLLSDGFWYVASGRSVLDGRGFPSVDPFSFSAVKTRWIVHMPGAVVLFAWLDRVFSLRALLVVSTLVETSALALLWLGRARHPLARAAILPLVAFAIVLQRDDLSARGQVFGDLGFVALLFVVDRMRRGGRARWWMALLAGAAWANLHSSFVLVVAVPLLFALAESLDATATSGWRRYATACVVFASAAALGTLVNPYGPALVVDVLSLASHPTTFEQKLFVSPEFARWDTLGVFGVAAIAAGLSSLSAARRRSELVVLAVFVGFGASAVRYLPHLVYFSIFVIAGHAQVIAEGARSTPRTARAWPMMAAAVTIVCALACVAVAARTPKSPTEHVPVEAAALVAARGLSPNVLNEYHWGGFLLYAWMGKPQVFIDGRSYLYFNGVFEDDRALEAAAPEAAQLLDAYDFRTALLERGSPLAEALGSLPTWRKVHEDRLAVVLVRVK